jgi:hypothetical protein
MKRFVVGEDRSQAVLLPEYLEDYVSDDNPVRVVDVFVDELDLRGLALTEPHLQQRDDPPVIRPFC